jgi:hypothetical protein
MQNVVEAEGIVQTGENAGFWEARLNDSKIGNVNQVKFGADTTS